MRKITSTLLAVLLLLGTWTATVWASPTDAAVIYGDLNGDGNISPTDALAVLRAAVGLDTLTGDDFTAADVNGDGVLSPVDALLVLRAAVGLDDKFPVELGTGGTSSDTGDASSDTEDTSSDTSSDTESDLKTPDPNCEHDWEYDYKEFWREPEYRTEEVTEPWIRGRIYITFEDDYRFTAAEYTQKKGDPSTRTYDIEYDKEVVAQKAAEYLKDHPSLNGYTEKDLIIAMWDEVVDTKQVLVREGGWEDRVVGYKCIKCGGQLPLDAM